MAATIGDKFKVTALLEHAESGQVANVYYFRLAGISNGGPDDAQVVEDLTLYLDDMYDQIYDLLDDGMVFVGINVFDYTNKRPLGTYSWPTQTNGTHVGTPLPSQVASFIQMNTGYSRSWGRKFLGVHSSSDNTSAGRIGSALLSALADFAAVWLAGYTGLGGDDWVPVIYNAKGNEWRDLIEAVIRDIWATINRRRIARGA